MLMTVFRRLPSATPLLWASFLSGCVLLAVLIMSKLTFRKSPFFSVSFSLSSFRTRMLLYTRKNTCRGVQRRVAGVYRYIGYPPKSGYLKVLFKDLYLQIAVYPQSNSCLQVPEHFQYSISIRCSGAEIIIKPFRGIFILSMGTPRFVSLACVSSAGEQQSEMMMPPPRYRPMNICPLFPLQSHQSRDRDNLFIYRHYFRLVYVCLEPIACSVCSTLLTRSCNSCVLDGSMPTKPHNPHTYIGY